MKILSALLSTAVVVAAAAAGTFAEDAAARAIYRCGPDGKTFSHAPCPEGSLVESSDPRTAAQRAEARRVMEREREREATAERVRRQAAASRAASAAPAAAEPSSTVTTGRATAPTAGEPGVIAISQPVNRGAAARP